MHNQNLYPDDFPEKYKFENIDLIELFHQKKWDKLNNIVICRDKTGKVTARFSDSEWDLTPYDRNHNGKNSFNFKGLDNELELQIEFKLIAYGLLFHKSRRGPAPKFSTVVSNISRLKTVYTYLKIAKQKSISHLSNKRSFEAFKSFLLTKNSSQRNLQNLFIALNNVIRLEPWLKYPLGFSEKLSVIALSKSLSNRELQQTLAIPEQLSNAIYGKAIELIQNALPHKDIISNTENLLQTNYLNGKKIIDEKIKYGARFTWTDANGNIINSQKYANIIAYYQPLRTKEIISPLSNQINGIQINSGIEFRAYIGQLITACFIICGGFSGMRESELDKLTPNSYYIDNVDGRDFHMLQSSTFKLGEKRETWITAPITKQAIELVSTLTRTWRSQIEYPDSRYINTLWCIQKARSIPPVLIKKWGLRLRIFCIKFNFLVTREDYQECIESNPSSLVKIKEIVTIGQPWPLAPHQLRRSLAFYATKHRLATKVALKQQFKHLYLAMAEWYSNGGQLASMRNLTVDNEIQQALNAVNAEMTASKIFKQWHSNEPLSGSHGKAIVKMRGDIPHIYSTWDTIYRAVLKGTLTLHGTAHSYCKNGYDCDMDGIVMPQFCVDCAGHGSIIDKDQALWWQKKHLSLVTYMEFGEDISVSERSHFITQIRAAENVMKDFDMPFIPFEPELKVTEL
ncbi:hypothetical protein G3485_20845 [Shewanella baltica]|uniref:Integrase n=1 Tax=Shewanella baltica (strain OS195) TaxID=399599 RepID=A9KVY4_SHEB9|nr:hypothetical protein [Shewanella baltica]ABX51558.1 conserved hypothetical protein [Shewanella baltica OS195]ADT96555.1 hypothetical protein Sbal678_4430 [Shewanella baltica OS678]EHC07376.1 hypothetical protein Sbal625DRAFT_0929 [Shewanella baltica OS625]MCS6129546.1 hypothetical protein [Shewanella baltica]MCS6141448.1 hypothetical protein [Shewanella baltica]